MVYYLHGDHLGSTSLVTCGSTSCGDEQLGEVVSRQLYYPYGEARYTDGTLPTDVTYTGHKDVPGTGLLFMRARYYHVGLARFTQADTIVPEPGDPQSLNRYSYVLGNPLRYMDPSGHCAAGYGGCGGGKTSTELLSYNANAWIVSVIQEQRTMIVEAANRHYLQPEFLAAVLYLENSNQLEQAVQSLPAGEAAQQAVKLLWNSVLLEGALKGEYKHLPWREGKKYEYFKTGRSQGIGAIKPEVAQYLLSQGLVFNPFTGEQADIPSSFIPQSLVPEEWSIEYLAAHLEAARNPKYDAIPWPESVSKSDHSSENALRLMVTYHHNMDNLIGWNDPSHPAYGAATAVIQWMPHMSKLLEE